MKCSEPIRASSYSVLGAPASIIGSELPWLQGSGPLSWIETFVTFCGMVGLQAMVLGRLGMMASPHPRACALSCPSPSAGRGSTGLRPFRYHALRGNPSGEEVRDDPHSDSRRGSNRCSVAPTAPPLKARVGAFGLRPLYCPWPRFLGSLSERGLHFAPLRVARDLGWCDHDYPRWGEHTSSPGKHPGTTPGLGSSASIIGSELSSLLGSGPSLRRESGQILVRV